MESNNGNMMQPEVMGGVSWPTIGANSNSTYLVHIFFVGSGNTSVEFRDTLYGTTWKTVSSSGGAWVDAFDPGVVESELVVPGADQVYPWAPLGNEWTDSMGTVCNYAWGYKFSQMPGSSVYITIIVQPGTLPEGGALRS